MNAPSAQTVLAAAALVILGVLGCLLVFAPVPGPNQTLLATIVGALAGALTVAGGSKLADKLTAPGAHVTADAPAEPLSPVP